MSELRIRLLEPTDSLAELTELLHRAYAALADMGLRYVATWQDEEITRNRIGHGDCYVAERDGRIVATVVLRPPENTRGCEWYDRPEVASFGQFAVEPDEQGTGVGAMLLEHIERRAREIGAMELALDTAEPAKHLIEYYERRGYRLTGEADWRPNTNYKSVIMSKAL